MRHLIVYAHPNPASLSHAMMEALAEVYRSQGDEVVIRDLYALGFEPVLKGSDFEALKAGSLPEDIATEQKHILWADTISVVAPVWWTGLPAILKGYIDRVYTYGFAYQFGPAGLEPLLKGKKVLLVSNHGNPAAAYEANGMYSGLRLTQDVGIYEFCGMEVKEHLFFPAVPVVDEETRKGYLAKVRETASLHFGGVTA